jgi:hypothetical protein
MHIPCFDDAFCHFAQKKNYSNQKQVHVGDHFVAFTVDIVMSFQRFTAREVFVIVEVVIVVVISIVIIIAAAESRNTVSSGVGIFYPFAIVAGISSASKEGKQVLGTKFVSIKLFVVISVVACFLCLLGSVIDIIGVVVIPVIQSTLLLLVG